MPRLPISDGKARWARPLLLVFALLLAWSSITQAGSMVFHVRNPSLALWFDADDPVALVRAAEARLAVRSNEDNAGARAVGAARRSIAQNPLNADAFGLYGLVRLANSDLSVIGRQMAMADRLSRRDLGTQLFLIEDSVRRNDVAEALEHYDTAMRVSDSIRPTLYPILTEAMREPAIRKRFLPYMDASTPWLEPFLRYAISNSSEPASIVALAVEAGGFPEGPQFATRVPELLSVVVGQEDYDTARRLYEVVGGGDPATLRDVRFTEATTETSLAPFTWQPFQMGDVDSLFIAGADSRLELEARMSAGVSAGIMRRLLALPPGTYAMAFPMQSEGHDPADTAQMQIACVSQGGRNVIADARRDLASEFVLGREFTVPRGCAYQMVTLSVSTRATPGEIVLTIDSPGLGTR
ncbi:MAG: hypothetical protein CL808_01990 [Citromicrobium sp.]|nr:hypothetical protein [Citromicrobium sp.]